MRCVVLHVKDNPKGDAFLPLYAAQVATISEYDSLEAAAISNVGSHPDARERGKPYRVIVIPEEHWHEFEVWSNRIHGRDRFDVVESTDRTIS